MSYVCIDCGYKDHRKLNTKRCAKCNRKNTPCVDCGCEIKGRIDKKRCDECYLKLIYKNRKEYYLKNIEISRKYKRDWWRKKNNWDILKKLKTKEEIRNYKNEWARKDYAKNSAKGLNKAHKSRTRLLNVVNTLTDQQWRNVLEFFNYVCVYCGSEEKITMDHIIPIISGGPHALGNVVPSCRSCNSIKHKNRLPKNLEQHLQKACNMLVKI